MNYQNELSELMELCLTSLTQSFRDVQSLYQDKASVDMTLNEVKILTSFCFNRKYQPLTIKMTKDKLTGLY